MSAERVVWMIRWNQLYLSSHCDVTTQKKVKNARLSIHPYTLGIFNEVREFIDKYSNRYENLIINVRFCNHSNLDTSKCEFSSLTISI